MAKRFRETELWDKRWYRKMGPEGRDLWNYLHDNCNFAGLLDIDCEIISTFLGFTVTLERIKEVLRNEFIKISDDKFFLPAFVFFQYGELSETSRPNVSTIKKLKAAGVWEQYRNFCATLVKGLPNSSNDSAKGMAKTPKGLLTPKDKEQDEAQEQDQFKEQDQDIPKVENFKAAAWLKSTEILKGITRPDDLIKFWNEQFAPKGYPFAPMTFGDAYIKKFFKINLRLVENSSTWNEYLERIDNSKFLTTKKLGGKPTVVWVLEEANFDEVNSGKYDQSYEQESTMEDDLNNLKLS